MNWEGVMDQQELKDRTKQFALRIIKLCAALPGNYIGRAIGNQLVRCGSSVGANYRAACRARSRAEFLSKLGIVEEESDESIFWMELIIDSEMIKKELVKPLLNEANELTAIFVQSIKSARQNSQILKSSNKKQNLKSAIRNPK